MERVRQIFDRGPVGLVATGLNAVLVAAVLWDQVPTSLATAWLVCQGIATFGRFAAYMRVRRTPPADAAAARSWLFRFRAGALLSGVLWGSAGVFLYPAGSLPHQIFLAFVLGGMLAGASGLFALDLHSFAAYAVPSLLPVVMRLLYDGGALHIAMGGMVFLFAALMSWIAILNNRSILTSLKLRAENVDLVESLTLEKERVELLNQDLSEEIIERERAEQELRDHRDHLEELVEDRARGLSAANSQLLEVITEREAAERQASRIAREWTSTFDNMLDMVAIIGQDMKIARANVPLARFLSVHPRELVGKPCHEVLHGTSAPPRDCPHQEALRNEGPVTRELDDARTGTPLLITCSPFTDEDGKIIGSVHVARDISEQRKAQVKREELISQLQQAVANVKMLSGLLPICSSCKKIRDDQGYWTQIEKYIRDRSEAEFSHGICPECAARLYPDYFPKDHPPKK